MRVIVTGRRRLYRLGRCARVRRSSPRAGRGVRQHDLRRQSADACRPIGSIRASRSISATSATSKRFARRFAEFQPDAIVHLAAELHVDRSIDRPAKFVETNVVGTQVLLDAGLALLEGAAAQRARRRSASFTFRPTRSMARLAKPAPSPRRRPTRRARPTRLRRPPPIIWRTPGVTRSDFRPS